MYTQKYLIFSNKDVQAVLRARRSTADLSTPLKVTTDYAQGQPTRRFTIEATRLRTKD